MTSADHTVVGAADGWSDELTEALVDARGIVPERNVSWERFHRRLNVRAARRLARLRSPTTSLTLELRSMIMRMFAGTLSALVLTLGAAAASAQPGRPALADGRGPRPGSDGPAAANPAIATADFLLAHTGDLALTDAQVVRLAAISRRVDSRRKATAMRIDSLRALDRSAPDSADPRGRLAMPSAELDQMRDRHHADVRDAIAVLTPDQQATAWLMMASRGPLGADPGGRGGPDGPMGYGGPREDAGAAPDRGPISRPPAARDVPRRPPGAEESIP